MRFKKGSKVEVLNRREIPSGSWCVAEIISGNGHYYNVIYDQCPPHLVDTVVDRVPRKAIRPLPSSVQCRRSWVAGDIVEVLDNGSWKLSEVSGVVEGDYYFVRLLGSSQTFEAHSSNLRLRQSWQDDKWVVIGQDSVNNGSVRLPPPAMDANILEPQRVSSRGIKRGSAHTQATRKMRAVDRDGMQQRSIAGHSSQLPEKGQSWGLVKLASKGPLMKMGFVTFLQFEQSGNIPDIFQYDLKNGGNWY